MKIEDMMSQKIWVPYLITRDAKGKTQKKPSCDGKTYAKWKKEKDLVLMTYSHAVARKESTPGLAGVGFVIPDGIAVIDLDVKKNDAGLKPASHNIISTLNSYTELSPSGKGGIHIIVQANLVQYSKLDTVIDGQSVEVILPGNFVTYTGNTIGGNTLIEDRGPNLLAMYTAANRLPSIKSPPNLPGSCKSEACPFSLGTCTYGLRALDTECTRVRGTTEGHRTKTLLGASRRIGRLIPDGHINETEATLALERAGRATGLPDEKVKSRVHDGIAKGKTESPPSGIHSIQYTKFKFEIPKNAGP